MKVAFSRLQEKYQKEILPALQQDLGRKNVLSIPKLEKIVISMGIGKALVEKTRIEKAVADLSMIAGQKPVVCKSRKSISNFKLREDYPIGCKVTLRGRRMYEFLDRLISVVTPRIRDFRGLSSTAFDGRGNYSMGLTDQSVFPEIEMDKVEFAQGMNVTICTSAHNDEEGRKLLMHFGMPLRT